MQDRIETLLPVWMVAAGLFIADHPGIAGWLLVVIGGLFWVIDIATARRR